MNVNEWRDYFEHTGQEWVNGAYNYEDYSYPVGYHRLRVLKKILKNYDLNGKKVLDIGCGGGDISFYVASLGAVVDGVDMTETMLEIANERRSKLKGATLENVHFHRCEFHSIREFFKREKFDYIIAFGLIGYIETDNLFFETVSELCHSETVLVLSCRNRLFNITSITPNTIAEIQQENAIHLIEEIDRCWQKEIPIPKQVKFVQHLKETVKHLDEGSNYVEQSKGNAEKNEIPGTGPRQPRQSSPEALKAVAKEYGFIPKSFFGVHPHLLLPRLNRKLPPTVFNALSDVLCVFEDEPISLVYSSVFVAEMVRG